ncbi:hypothetical protein A6D6_00188 [Alcanivorax xiamenensis]|uniref:Isochorismatase-like domain-containing protein n=1 Tax=Alcanivorax xiamenensis TaxID=1177156 RepID=A0ABQ6YED4_9GAMM|nr:cysteine hydrolase family protein [Alcanivorax xiamenensis]KAF0808479.1 hypothetical protein A6D6_00188 [Alcanivorax xiamenensis]
MRQALLIVDVQPSFSPPTWLLRDIDRLLGHMPTVATVECHDEAITPFQAQLGWRPPERERSLIAADRQFVKHGYRPTDEVLNHLIRLVPERVLVCGIQTETCVLAAGFALFDLGLRPTLVTDLTVGSSLDPPGELGIRLWRHHFRHITTLAEVLGTSA